MLVDSTALGGELVGTLFEQERRFDMVAKLDQRYLSFRSAVGRLPVGLSRLQGPFSSGGGCRIPGILVMSVLGGAARLCHRGLQQLQRCERRPEELAHHRQCTDR